MENERINGITIKSARLKRGVSIRQLADMAGVNKTTIQRIEKGEVSPSLEVLERILDALSLRIAIEEK